MGVCQGYNKTYFWVYDEDGYWSLLCRVQGQEFWREDWEDMEDDPDYSDAWKYERWPLNAQDGDQVYNLDDGMNGRTVCDQFFDALEIKYLS
jgi:hypothetical protein